MSGYDAWLERPYVEAAEQAEAYEKYVEDNDLDPDEDWSAEFERYMDDLMYDDDRGMTRAEYEADQDECDY